MLSAIAKTIVRGLSDATALKIQVGATLGALGLGLWWQKKDSDRYHQKCEAVEDRFDEMCSKLESGEPVEACELLASSDMRTIHLS